MKTWVRRMMRRIVRWDADGVEVFRPFEDEPALKLGEREAVQRGEAGLRLAVHLYREQRYQAIGALRASDKMTAEEVRTWCGRLDAAIASEEAIVRVIERWR